MDKEETTQPEPLEDITDEEVQIHVQYIIQALSEPDLGKRNLILTDAVLSFGTRFLDSLTYCINMEEKADLPFEELKDQTQQVLTSILSGKKMTDRVDEDERRAYLALELFNGQDEFRRMAAAVLLQLPDDHPLRDIDQIKQSLLTVLEEESNAGRYDNAILALNNLFSCPFHKSEYLELIEWGNSIAQLVPEYNIRATYHLGVIAHYLDVVLGDDEKSDEELNYYSVRAYELVLWMKEEFPDRFADARGMNVYATVMAACKKDNEAADAYAEVVDKSSPHEEVYQSASVIESRFRMDFGQYNRVIQILTPVVPYLEENYLLAVGENNISDTGESYYDAVWNLAYAHAYSGSWDKSIAFLERGKSRRLLFQGAIRNKEEGKQLLDLEKKLHHINRKVDFPDEESKKLRHEDWFNEKISLKSRILEEYRKQKKNLAVNLIDPSLEAISSNLHEDEAFVSLGLTKRGGTVLIVICKNDKEKPAATFIDNSMNFKRWVPVLAGENEDGWLFALGAVEAGIEYRTALTGLLPKVDDLIGVPLKKMLEGKNIRRLTIIPHHWLHLIPFWALPSLQEYEVAMSGSAAHFIEARRKHSYAGRNALVISNPTSDLPCSQVESGRVRKHLQSAGFHIRCIEGEEATEKNVIEALGSVSLFHFCGHGRSDMDNPSKSSLMVSVDRTDPRIKGDDPFKSLISLVGEWKNSDEMRREASVPGIGYLYEMKTATGEILERVLETGESTSLLGLYYNGQLENLMEMWSAGDIMIQGSLSNCSIAFLSACEVGLGSSVSFGIDEYAGLPAALQLAGVKTVICSLWPVEDVLATLYVDLFYQDLSQMKGSVNLTALVKSVNDKIRRMPLEVAIVLLNRLRSATEDQAVQEDIGYYIDAIKEEGNEFPFSHPLDWAAFYVTGAPNMTFADYL